MAEKTMCVSYVLVLVLLLYNRLKFQTYIKENPDGDFEVWIPIFCFQHSCATFQLHDVQCTVLLFSASHNTIYLGSVGSDPLFKTPKFGIFGGFDWVWGLEWFEVWLFWILADLW